jgi:hypothetical protein
VLATDPKRATGTNTADKSSAAVAAGMSAMGGLRTFVVSVERPPVAGEMDNLLLGLTNLSGRTPGNAEGPFSSTR